MPAARSKNTQFPNFDAKFRGNKENNLPPLALVKAKNRPQVSVHKAVFQLFAAINTAILVVFWFTFRNDSEALFMVAISTIYLAAYMATPFIMSHISHFDRPNESSFHAFLKGSFESWTGEVSGRQVLVQILLIPSAILTTVIGISIIINYVR